MLNIVVVQKQLPEYCLLFEFCEGRSRLWKTAPLLSPYQIVTLGEFWPAVNWVNSVPAISNSVGFLGLETLRIPRCSKYLSFQVQSVT